jgi:hypothetical protein
MRLTDLLEEIERSTGAVTVGDLAKRLASTPAAVEAGLAALRASGRIGPEGSVRPGTEACASVGSCAMTCPGPATCPFVLDLGGALELRRR